MTKDKNSQSRVAQKTTKRRLRKRVKFIIIPLLIIFIAVGGYAINLYVKAGSAIKGAYENDGRDKSDLRDEYVDPKFDNVSILLLGIDENEKRKDREISRTDAIVLATLNKDDKSIKLVSIPRDAYVYIPQVGYEDKINHAYAFGEAALARYENGEHFDDRPSGSKATIDTIENLFDIPVDYYVRLNFHSFVEVVNAIGGIDVEVPYEFKESNSNDKRDTIHLMPGMQTLNGEEALALARTRKQDTDYLRGQRQLEIIDAIIKKSTSVTSVLKYDDIIEAVGNNMGTNMTFTEMKSFFSYATHGSKLNVERIGLDGYDYQPAGTYYWQIDENSLYETIADLKAHLELANDVDQDLVSDEGEQTNIHTEFEDEPYETY